MSATAAASGPAMGEGEVAGPAIDEACPLCGERLDGEQEWCLRCGAAARTRLAGAPNWKGPVVGLGAVGAIALGVLAAALVALTGSSGSGTPASTVTRTVTTPAAAAGALGSGAAGAAGATGGSAGTATTGTGSSPGGVVNPGTPTTIKPAGEGTGTSTAGAAGELSRARREKVGGVSLPSEEALRKAGFLRRGRR